MYKNNDLAQIGRFSIYKYSNVIQMLKNNYTLNINKIVDKTLYMSTLAQ